MASNLNESAANGICCDSTDIITVENDAHEHFLLSDATPANIITFYGNSEIIDSDISLSKPVDMTERFETSTGGNSVKKEEQKSLAMKGRSDTEKNTLSLKQSDKNHSLHVSTINGGQMKLEQHVKSNGIEKPRQYQVKDLMKAKIRWASAFSDEESHHDCDRETMGMISYEYLIRRDGPVTSHVLADGILRGDHLEGIVCDVQGKILGSYKANCPRNTCTRSTDVVHKLISEGEDMRVSSKVEWSDDDDGFTRTVSYLQQSSPF